MIPRRFNQCTTYTPTFAYLVMPLPRIDAHDGSPGGCVATYTVLFWTVIVLSAQRSTFNVNLIAFSERT